MPELFAYLDSLRAIAREYPALIALLSIVLLAGLFVLTDELVRSLKWHSMNDAQKAQRALELANKAAMRAHEWH